MTPMVLWAVLPVTVIGGIALVKFFAARRARTEELRMLAESPHAVSLMCRLDGHAYTESETGVRCDTCGSQLSRAEAGIEHVATVGPRMSSGRLPGMGVEHHSGPRPSPVQRN